MKYICLLRGINIGGNNKVPMSELKKCFESIGFQNVTTYINSGNVLFDSAKKNDAAMVSVCGEAFMKTFGFSVPMAVISENELETALREKPSWWNKNPSDKNNAIFVIAPATTRDVMKDVGEAKPEYENVEAHGPIIFWTAPIKTLSRTRYSKIVSSKAYDMITIRNANTTLKLLELAKAL
jgi:uncharacterized protein (DUF1697 family)